MKQFARVSAALLSIVAINTIGGGAYAVCVTFSDCMESCRQSFGGSFAGIAHCLNKVCNGNPHACIKAQGRVKTGTPSPKLSICEAAQKARARNSPAAPGLEAQCRATGASDAAVQDNADTATRGRQERRDDPR